MHDKKYIRFQAMVIAVGVVILLLKFLAFYITGSNAIFSDAMESIVNVVAGSFALYSLVLAAKPKDRDHPYGHGKIEFISAGIEGTLIVMAGAGIVYRAIGALMEGHQLAELDTGMFLAGAAGLINYLLGYFTEKYGKAQRSATMIASGKHLMSDGYTSAGMILGLVVVKMTDWVWVDSAIALGFGMFIGYIGLREIRKSYAGIMDEADFELVEKVVTLIESNRSENWIDLHNFRMQQFGKQVHIDCHMTLPYYFTIEQAHTEIDRVEQLVKDRFPSGLEMFVHIDPCTPRSCRICSKPDCPVRQSPQEERIIWSLQTVLANRQHR